MVQFHYSWVFLQFLTCSTKLISKHIPKNDSARESVTAAAMAALTRRMNSLSEKRLPFFLPAELPEMFKHPARVRQDPPLKWQEKSELSAHPCLLCGVCECSFRMESLQCCSGPWLPEKWVWDPQLSLCRSWQWENTKQIQVKAGLDSTIWWAQAAEWRFVLGFFLENARGFQGIDDILYWYFRGEDNSYSSGSATTCKTLWSGWGTFSPEIFPPVIKARAQRVSILGGQGPELFSRVTRRWLRGGSTGRVTVMILGALAIASRQCCWWQPQGWGKAPVGPCPPGTTP